MRIAAIGHRLARVFIAQLIEREVDPPQQVEAGGQRGGAGAEQAGEFGGGFEVAFGVCLQPLARRLDRHALADAGQDIVELARLRTGIKRIGGGEQRHARRLRQRLPRGQQARVAAPARHRRGQPDGIGADFAQAAQQRGVAAGGDQQQVLRIVAQVIEVQDAVALLGAAVAQGQQPGQPPPAGAGGGIGDHIGRAIGKHQPRADGQPEAALRPAQFAPGGVGAHYACHRVAIRDPDPRQPQVMRPRNHLRRVRGTAQEAVVGGRDQLGKRSGHQANSPCRNQRGSARSV